MKQSVAFEVAVQVEMWAAMGSLIRPVPREVVRATAYDEHVAGTDREALYRRIEKRSPSTSSGHLGKELNLMLSGEKRVALIDDDELAPWIPHLIDGDLLAFVDGFPGNYVVIHRADVRFIEQILAAQMSGLTTGVALGYQPTDIVKAMRSEDRHFAKMAPITDEDHAEVVAEAVRRHVQRHLDGSA